MKQMTINIMYNTKFNTMAKFNYAVANEFTSVCMN